jgi:hypothetical protein
MGPVKRVPECVPESREPAGLGETERLHSARNGLVGTLRRKMMSEDAKFALGY